VTRITPISASVAFYSWNRSGVPRVPRAPLIRAASAARIEPSGLAFRLRAPRFGGLNPFRSSRSERRRVGKPKGELREIRDLKPRISALRASIRATPAAALTAPAGLTKADSSRAATRLAHGRSQANARRPLPATGRKSTCPISLI